MSDVKKFWNDSDGRLYLSNPSQEFEMLEEGSIYSVGIDNYGRFFLIKKSDGYTFDYKLYGLETEFTDRVLKTYRKTSGNLGILLNGIKGTGKTVSSKIIANKVNQPIIVVNAPINGLETFLNTITQDITIFVDEYEKIYGESSKMLTIMDGALNSTYRRLFLLTTNELYVDRNIIQRPSRVRYLKMFNNLSPEVVEEVVNDILEYTEFKDDCINFISNLETITIDIVKAVLLEVNIHQESPSVFENVFNVKKIKGKYNLIVLDDGKQSELAKSVGVYPRPTFSDGVIGNNFSIDGQRIGLITRVINWTTIEVSPYTSDDSKGSNLGFDEPIILKLEDADVVNNTYAYHDMESYGFDKPARNERVISPLASKIFKSLNDNEEEGEYSESEVQQVSTEPMPKMVAKGTIVEMKERPITLSSEDLGSSSSSN